MKRIVSMVCAAFLLLSCTAIISFRGDLNVNASSFDGLYDIDTGFMYYDGSIVGYTKIGYEVVIPSAIHGKKIDGISSLLFYPIDYATKFVNVSAEKPVKYSTIEEVMQKASRTDEIQPMFSVGIHESIVYQYRPLIKKIIISEGISKIYSNAFRNFTALEEVVLPSTLTSIGDEAFFFCSNLKIIRLPDKLTSIGKKAFSGCTQLKDVVLPPALSSSVKSAFDSYDQISGERQTVNGIKYIGNILTGHESIPENGKAEIRHGTSVIDDSAFENCVSLTEVIIPDTVKYIGSYAFAGCTNLGALYVPNSVKSIDNSVLKDCKADMLTVYADSGTVMAKYAEKNGLKVRTLKEYKDISRPAVSSDTEYAGSVHSADNISPDIVPVANTQSAGYSSSKRSNNTFWVISCVIIILIISSSALLIKYIKNKQ